MSFMAVAVGMGASGIGAAMLAGGMMGGATTFGMNILSGRDAFSNMGQGMLMGAAGSGLVSGLGSLAGGATEATQATQQLATREAQEIAREAATQQSLAPGMSQYSDVSKFVNPPAMSTSSMASLEPSQYQQIGGANTFDPYTSEGLNPANNGVGGVGTVASAPPAPPPIASAAPDVSQFTQPQPIKPAELMKNPADYMVQNPSKVAAIGSGLTSLLNPQQRGIANPIKGPGGNNYNYPYQPAQYDSSGRTIKPASYGNPAITHYAAAGGAIKHYAKGSQAAVDAANMYGDSSGKGPYNDSNPIYGSEDGPMYTDSSKYAHLAKELNKLTPTQLAAAAADDTDPIENAEAEKLLRIKTARRLGAYKPRRAAAQSDTTNMAQGGIASLPQYAAGGDTTSQYNYDPSSQTYTPPSQPQAASNSGDLRSFLKNFFGFGQQASPSQKYSYDSNQQQYTKMAQGGVASLGGDYAAGGKLLQGPGDGMSDSIPAVIQGAKPQRAALAQGEFVVPADVVSHLGNGSTDAGAKRLYAMMDKIRHARTGNKKQGKQINPNNFLPV
tara:strand:+ start:895 stop:2562 length:1668 start_codon:yes stop_codon:yes gene_type:complete